MIKKRIKTILNYLLSDIAEVYPYFLVFYVFSLALSLFFASWRLFFYWPAMHIGAALLGVMFLLSAKGKDAIVAFLEPLKRGNDKVIESGKTELARFKKETAVKKKTAENLFRLFVGLLGRFFKKVFKIAIVAKKIFVQAVYFLLKIILFLLSRLLAEIVQLGKETTKKDYLKAGLMGAVLIFSLYEGIKIIEFIILVYALFSILFGLESKIAASVALAFLAVCPVLLIFKKEALAETAAIYAYYFLVITVITQIRNYIKSAKNETEDLSTG